MNDSSKCLARYARLDHALLGGADRLLLCGDEAQQYEQIHNVARRRQWLSGRLVARALLSEALGIKSDRDLQILSRDQRNMGTSPSVMVAGQRLDIAISISHAARGVLVAIGLEGNRPLGVDLCADVSATPGFLRLWFTQNERSWIQTNRHRAATIWAMKEAVYKAVSNGAPWNPREIEILPNDAADFECRFQGQLVAPLTLWRQTVDGHVAAIACLASDAEICLTQPNRLPRVTRLRSKPAPQLTA